MKLDSGIRILFTLMLDGFWIHFHPSKKCCFDWEMCHHPNSNFFSFSFLHCYFYYYWKFLFISTNLQSPRIQKPKSMIRSIYERNVLITLCFERSRPSDHDILSAGGALGFHNRKRRGLVSYKRSSSPSPCCSSINAQPTRSKRDGKAVLDIPVLSSYSILTGGQAFRSLFSLDPCFFFLLGFWRWQWVHLSLSVRLCLLCNTFCVDLMPSALLFIRTCHLCLMA